MNLIEAQQALAQGKATLVIQAAQALALATEAKKQVDDMIATQAQANEAVTQSQTYKENVINYAIYAQEFEEEQERALRELEAMELEITRIVQVAETIQTNLTQTTQGLIDTQTTATEALNLVKTKHSAIVPEKSEWVKRLAQVKTETQQAEAAKIVAEQKLTAAQTQVALIIQRLTEAKTKQTEAEANAATASKAISKIEQFRNIKQNRVAINKSNKLPIGVYSSNNMTMYATVGRY